jgi:hypothetical protein
MLKLSRLPIWVLAFAAATPALAQPAATTTNIPTIVKHVPPRDPVTGQLKITPAQGSQWRQVPIVDMPRDVRCFSKPKPADNHQCNDYSRAFM